MKTAVHRIPHVEIHKRALAHIQIQPQSTSSDTHCKYAVRIPGCFDLPAAVMSLVVKLLFPFNIVYRQRHLLEETVICTFLIYTVFPISALAPLLQGIDVTDICRYVCFLIPSTYFGDLFIFILPIDDI